MDMNPEQLAKRLDGVEAAGIECRKVRSSNAVMMSYSNNFSLPIFSEPSNLLAFSRAVCRAAGDRVVEDHAAVNGALELTNMNLVGLTPDEKDDHIFACHEAIRRLTTHRNGHIYPSKNAIQSIQPVSEPPSNPFAAMDALIADLDAVIKKAKRKHT